MKYSNRALMAAAASLVAMMPATAFAEGSAGGHNGIKSIIQELGSQSFPRVKIGVGSKPTPEFDLAAWVLSTFSASEEKALSVSLENAGKAALTIVAQGVPEAANRFNGSHP